MHVLGDTQVFIKCSNFINVILSGPAIVLRNLSQQVIVGMNIVCIYLFFDQFVHFNTFTLNYFIRAFSILFS